ncbi:MAG: PorP/SprF family type IX secretion system membrane protein [Bacteroidales bacterium]|nr:PorP/SprF family type IX secretion system membrane protein [Bacteroidales bacterium]
MKKLIILITSILIGAISSAQQVPISENYYMDRYSLAPSYAGNYNAKYLFMGYRSDWTGIDGGPKTVRISYSDLLPSMKNAGFGGKIIYDKAGIFSQLYILGSYSYNLLVNQDHHIMFGLSMGFYRNKLNLLDYYNDPDYTIDPALVSLDINSKLKFMSDFSAVWTWKGAEAGFMFSNISLGDASYKEVSLKYNPLANYQFHATYIYNINEDWDLTPLLIVRGGKYIKSQFEIATQVMYLKKFWGSLVYRDPAIIGFGAGASINKGLKIGYNFNFATNVVMGAFNNHEITIGLNIFEYLKKSE